MKKIPGVSGYRAISQGVKALGQDAAVAAASQEAAARIQAEANRLGSDTYSRGGRTVRIGWSHDQRSGAAVSGSGDPEHAPRDAKDEVLKQALRNQTRRA